MALDPDLTRRPLVYPIPSTKVAQIRKDVAYKSTGDTLLQLDAYHPPGATMSPAVVFLHGDATPDALKRPKEWGQYVGWGQLVAASGLVGVTANRRSTENGTRLAESAQDVDDLLSYVRTHANDLQLDSDRLCLWVCSAGAPVALRTALRDRPGFVCCIVAYYPLLNLVQLRPEVDASISDGALREFSPLHHVGDAPGRRFPPMLIVRAGRDHPVFNTSIDEFVAEALKRNIPLELINYSEGRHAFDLLDDNDSSRDIIRRTLSFIGRHLNV